MTPTFLQRFGRRVGLVALVLYAAPTPVDSIPLWGDALTALQVKAWSWPIGAVGRVLGLEVGPYQLTGSGDTLFEWLRLLCVVLFSVVLTTAWAFDARRTNDDVVRDVWRGYARVVLATAMVGYGWAKLTLSQMPVIDDTLTSGLFSESSPMGLVWKFMGASPAYERIAGGLEFAGGLLLLTRRTTTLGALLLCGVMAQVVLLNFCFDVPVKQYSTILWLLAVGLAWPAFKPLFTLLFWHRVAEPTDALEPAYWVHGRGRLARIGGFSAAMAISAWSLAQSPGEPPDTSGPPEAWVGVYWVTEQTAGPRWHQVTVNRWGTAQVRNADGERVWWRIKVDEAAHSLQLASIKDGTPQTLSYEQTAEGEFTIHGSLGEEPLAFTMKRAKPGLLMTRGFHWVQEWPFNR